MTEINSNQSPVPVQSAVTSQAYYVDDVKFDYEDPSQSTEANTGDPFNPGDSFQSRNRQGLINSAYSRISQFFGSTGNSAPGSPLNGRNQITREEFQGPAGPPEEDAPPELKEKKSNSGYTSINNLVKGASNSLQGNHHLKRTNQPGPQTRSPVGSQTVPQTIPQSIPQTVQQTVFQQVISLAIQQNIPQNNQKPPARRETPAKTVYSNGMDEDQFILFLKIARHRQNW
jgi:hypothetical protein